MPDVIRGKQRILVGRAKERAEIEYEDQIIRYKADEAYLAEQKKKVQEIRESGKINAFDKIQDLRLFME